MHGLFDNVSVITPTVVAAIPNTAMVGSATAGSYVTTDGVTLALSSTGGDISGTADSLQFAYVQVTGNASVTARLTGTTYANTLAKGGVMIRSDLSAGAIEMGMVTAPTGGARAIYRTTENAASSAVLNSGHYAPLWVRVTRVGNVLTAYRSSNGTARTTQSTQAIAMGATVYVGLVASAYSGTATSTFDNIAVTGTVNTATTITAGPIAGTTTVTGTSTTLSVTAADGDGGEAVNLSYDWVLANLPPADVAFSANGTTAASGTTATFAKAGIISNGKLTGWYNGDFNNDGSIDGSDYTLIDNAFNEQPITAVSTVAVVKSAATVTVATPTARLGSTLVAAASVDWTDDLRKRRRPVVPNGDAGHR